MSELAGTNDVVEFIQHITMMAKDFVDKGNFEWKTEGSLINLD